MSQYLELREKLNEARCAEIKAQRIADDACWKARLAEVSYQGACNRVRTLEEELNDLKRRIHV